MNWEKIFSFILFLFFNITIAQEKTNIAVLELEREGITASESRIISSRLRTDLFNTNKYSVLERDAMDEILAEQGFQQSGCTTKECIVEVGKLLGVRLIVAGEIGKISDLYTISIRLIDVQTGKILKTATEDCDCNIKTVLTKSVKNVAQILSGNEVKTTSYTNIKDNDKKDNSPSIQLNDWQSLGLTRDEYIEFTKSGIGFDEFLLYQDEKKGYFWPVCASVVPGYIVHGMGHYLIGEYKTGLILSAIGGSGLFLAITSKDRPILRNVGAVLFLGSQLYDIIYTPIRINDFNENLNKKYKISLFPIYEIDKNHLKLGLVYNF